MIFVVLRKEIRDLLRDKRTVLVSIIIPIILFPLIFSIMNVNVRRNEQLRDHLRIAIRGQNPSLRRFLNAQKNITVRPSDEPLADLRAGTVHAVIMIPDNSAQMLEAGKTATVTIAVDNTSQISLMAYGILKDIIESHGRTILQKRLTLRGIDRSLLKPIAIKKKTTLDEETGTGTMLLSLLLPLLLLVFSATSPLAVAADLIAGEKERSSLEPLLSTPVDRISLLIGKFLAVTAMGIIGVIAFMCGLIISFAISPDFFGADKLSFAMSPLPLGLIALLTVILTMIFGATELAISIFARSSREAQTYFLPVIIISVAAGYSSVMVDPKNFDPPYLHIPLVNISITIKELAIGIVEPASIAITLSWSLAYIVLAILLSRILFAREGVLFRM